MDFSSLGLSQKLLTAIAQAGFIEPTPIQQEVIPLVLNGRDVFGSAQTGTGKTASFVIPLLEKLFPDSNFSTSPARHPLRALILAPTRELTEQINGTIEKIASGSGVKHISIFGGVDIHKQIANLRLGQEIIIATPGRLLDLMSQKILQIPQTLKYLVIDEADLMCDMGFMPDIVKILKQLPSPRQTLFFSATQNNAIKDIRQKILNSPAWIEVAPKNSISSNVTHAAFLVSEEKKRSLLKYILPKQQQALIFVETRDMCSQLSHWLKSEGIWASELHGNKAQQERTRILESFKQGKIQFLVATDLASRGLDIEELPYVINFSLPHGPENYVHRVGRTGRGSHQGNAISLVCEYEEKKLLEIESLIGQRIDRLALPIFSSPPSSPKEGASSYKKQVASLLCAPLYPLQKK